MGDFIVRIATEADGKYAAEIVAEMERSAKIRGTGISKRSPEYIVKKMAAGQAVIALDDRARFAGFCYIETWSHGKYVANSGLIVNPDYRGKGLAKRIKFKSFELSRKKFPEAKLFGNTTSLAVMKINSELGYKPVPYSELTRDKEFWATCSSCVNYEILKSKNHENCLCTGMLYDPADKKKSRWEFVKKSKAYERLMRLKRAWFMK